MAKNIVMPALEMAQETGTIVSWLKKEGDPVTKGEPLLEIETDKATVEIEALSDGILAGVKAAVGDEIPVGETIAWIVAPGEEPPKESASTASGRSMSQKPSSSSDKHDSRTKASAGDKKAKVVSGPKVSPKARRLAKEHGVNLATVGGTGPDGAITGADVLTARKSSGGATASPDESTEPPPSAIARLMAERTTQSWNQAPHFFLTREVDATGLNALRAKVRPGIEKDKGVKVTHTDILVALIGRVLEKHPKMNATWDGNRIRINPKTNVCIAMAVEDGVVSPVVADTNKAELADIALRRRELTERARSGKLRPPDITGGTFTISNLGMFSIDAFTAIIVPPQAAILAVGAITDRVVPVDGKPGIRPTMMMSLSSDHRVVDGAQAALFLNDLVEAIKDPEKAM